MKHHHNTPPAESEKPRRFEPSWRTTAALSATATLLASIMATGIANDPEADRPPRGGIETSVGGVDVNIGGLQQVTEDVSLPGIRFDAAGEQVAEFGQGPDILVPEIISLTEEEQVVSEFQLMEWARLFDADPRAKETLDAELGLRRFVKQLQKYVDAGYSIDTLTLRGHASDEDDYGYTSGDGNPGFGIDSEKNVRLADTRAEAVEELLAERLQQAGISVNIDILDGKEVQDSQLAAEIEQLALTKSITAHELVMRYNRDRDSLTAADLEILDGLRDDRYVEGIAGLSRETQTVVYHEVEGEWIEQQGSANEASLVIVPIIIPWGRLRRRPSDSMPDDTTPPLVTVPPVVPGATPSGGSKGPKQQVPRDRHFKKGGKAHGGYSRAAHHHKQPGQLNNGGNSGSFGQRNPHNLSRYTMNRNR